MKKSIIIIVVLIACGSIVLYLWQVKFQVVPQTDLDKNSGLQQFKNDDLKLSFDYPKEWGEISIKNEPDHISLAIDLDVFLGADNGGDSMGRGGYWGDEAVLITDQNYVNNFCNGKVDCQIMTNKSGIIFAREKKLFDSLSDQNQRDSIFYYIFNPKSKFRGIILSDEGLINMNIESIESKIDSLVDSIEFIN